jgi:hypothetical protein
MNRAERAKSGSGHAVKFKLDREALELSYAIGNIQDRAAYLLAKSARGALFQIALISDYEAAIDDGIDNAAGAKRAIRLMLYSVRSWIEQGTATAGDAASEYFMCRELNPHLSIVAALTAEAA